MAIDHLNFHSGGSKELTESSAREILDNQFKEMNLNLEARNHFARELKGRITKDDFERIIDDADKMGIIDSDKARKMKNAVKMPPNFEDSLNK